MNGVIVLSRKELRGALLEAGSDRGSVGDLMRDLLRSSKTTPVTRPRRNWL